MITETIVQRSIQDFAADVRAGLTTTGQKQLPSNYLYDEVGSALFDAITLLPEYGLYRADERILRQHAEEIVRVLLPATVVVAELGSGSGKKTRWILEALSKHQHTSYFPIDISSTALAHCAKEINQLDRVSFAGIHRSYLEGLTLVTANREARERLLLLFLGSTIGNFDRSAGEEFLEEVRSRLLPGDALLLGADLVKEVGRLVAAYDDPAGVTASFNLNLLARLNRELGADFDLSAFGHLALYDEGERRIEMHLMSERDQQVTIPGADCSVSLRGGETIWTESSYKYRTEEILKMAERSGFRTEAQWVDGEWPFAESLLIAD
ncbi:MAG TPA: L-histidine N(alpha)-methyltransferase [Candidatus Acidoferrales bacterium]|jgi:dimethylhistidine N-methyltransferase|nr:L-histidine N(alpha)-methyltransferase [Candidatus Acidoferrales bacterium]